MCDVERIRVDNVSKAFGKNVSSLKFILKVVLGGSIKSLKSIEC